jgi:ATP phosphoribosyltransferase regulatory subunit HisZ
MASKSYCRHAVLKLARRQVLDLFQRWGYEFVVTRT